MSKSEKQIIKSLRERGVRKSLAGDMAKATGGKVDPKKARRAVSDLESVVEEIRDRLRGGPEKRSSAAKKAARTRKRKARQRSESAKRGARTRARG